MVDAGPLIALFDIQEIVSIGRDVEFYRIAGRASFVNLYVASK